MTPPAVHDGTLPLFQLTEAELVAKLSDDGYDDRDDDKFSYLTSMPISAFTKEKLESMLEAVKDTEAQAKAARQAVALHLRNQIKARAMELEDKKQQFVTVINSLVQSQDELRKTAGTLQEELESKLLSLKVPSHFARATPCANLTQHAILPGVRLFSRTAALDTGSILAFSICDAQY